MVSSCIHACRIAQGSSWPWSYGSRIYNTYAISAYYGLSPLMLRVRISVRARYTSLFDQVWQSLAIGLWCFLCPLVSSTNKTGRHDIPEILFKVALNTIKPTNQNHTTHHISLQMCHGIQWYIMLQQFKI